MNDMIIRELKSNLRLQIGITVTVIGFLVFWLGATPGLFGQDRSPAVGFIQLAVIITGLGLICLGGCISLMWYWKGREMSIPADFGWRIVWTGFIIALWSCMADMWGFGTKTLCFGPWQEKGVLTAQVVIAIGLLMLVPWKKHHHVEENPPENINEKR